MLTRLNTSNEISILPSGLGNHYTSESHLIPPGRPNYNFAARPSIFSKSSVEEPVEDADAPEANMSFRSQTEYFGADVLVIVGVVLASAGAILTLVSFYCQFRHPAVQATIAGIGPSLIGIGMLFCVLRLFFCSFFTTRTCCECFAEGLKYMMRHCGCSKSLQTRTTSNKKIHPLQVKPIANGDVKNKMASDTNGNELGQPIPNHVRFVSRPIEMEPIREQSRARGAASETNLSVNRSPFPRTKRLNLDEDMLREEIAILDQRLSSADSDKAYNQSINELVLKHSRHSQ